MTTNVSTVMATIDPIVAKKMLESDLYKGQRNIRPWHVTELATAMKNGHFTEGTQIFIAKSKSDSKRHIVNGQHTLNAIVESGISIDLTVTMAELDSEDDIAILYSRFDRHLPRTIGDTMKAHGAEEKTGLNKSQINLVNAGIRAIINKFSNSSGSTNSTIRSSDSRAEMFFEYADGGKEYFDTIAGCPALIAKRIKTGVAVGIALLTFKKDEVLAREFWHGVAFSGKLEDGDPRKTLSDWLLVNTNKTTTPAWQARAIEKAWISFLAGNKIKRFVGIDPSRPILLP